MPSATRERIVNSSAELFRRQGYTGTGLKQVTALAEAPFGSLYHFFPGGKEHLGEEVIRTSGRFFAQIFRDIALAAPDAPTAVESFFTGAARTLVDTDYADACPIATVALEVASTNERLREATADVFASWLADAQAGFVQAGIPEDRARELALMMLASLEGAFILCRATRTTDALEVAGREMSQAVARAIPGRARSSPGRR
jgi:AcrR family transcriptional regulator